MIYIYLCYNALKYIVYAFEQYWPSIWGKISKNRTLLYFDFQRCLRLSISENASWVQYSHFGSSQTTFSTLRCLLKTSSGPGVWKPAKTVGSTPFIKVTQIWWVKPGCVLEQNFILLIGGLCNHWHYQVFTPSNAHNYVCPALRPPKLGTNQIISN